MLGENPDFSISALIPKQKQNVLDSKEFWDVSLNSPPPKSAHNQYVETGDERLFKIAQISIITLRTPQRNGFTTFRPALLRSEHYRSVSTTSEG
jgi:hypothetical protein